MSFIKTSSIALTNILLIFVYISCASQGSAKINTKNCIEITFVGPINRPVQGVRLCRSANTVSKLMVALSDASIRHIDVDSESYDVILAFFDNTLKDHINRESSEYFSLKGIGTGNRFKIPVFQAQRQFKELASKLSIEQPYQATVIVLELQRLASLQR